MLGFLVKFVLATICWLGLFEPHLIQPMTVLPVSAILDVLGAGDYLLWIFTFAAIELADRATTWYGQRQAPGRREQVAKRGDRMRPMSTRR